MLNQIFKNSTKLLIFLELFILYSVFFITIYERDTFLFNVDLFEISDARNSNY